MATSLEKQILEPEVRHGSYLAVVGCGREAAEVIRVLRAVIEGHAWQRRVWLSWNVDEAGLGAAVDWEFMKRAAVITTYDPEVMHELWRRAVPARLVENASPEKWLELAVERTAAAALLEPNH